MPVAQGLGVGPKSGFDYWIGARTIVTPEFSISDIQSVNELNRTLDIRDVWLAHSTINDTPPAGGGTTLAGQMDWIAGGAGNGTARGGILAVGDLVKIWQSSAPRDHPTKMNFVFVPNAKAQAAETFKDSGIRQLTMNFSGM